MARLTPERFETISERIGYRFQDRLLLVTALSHSSMKRKHGDYERLEFLGDRVLGLVIAEYLFRRNATHREGDLAASHSALVRAEACADAGVAIDLSDMIMVGTGERAKGMNTNRTVQGDVMEALIAAIYLDGGLEAARDFVMRLWEPLIAEPGRTKKDAKTFLQEWVLARALPIPVYRMVKREGSEHEPLFVVELDVAGKAPASGTGKSKRAAEQEAAEALLKRERIRR